MSDSESEEDESLQYKIILLGDGTVGKTSIAMRFTNDEFGHQYKQVAGCDVGWSMHLFVRSPFLSRGAMFCHNTPWIALLMSIEILDRRLDATSCSSAWSCPGTCQLSCRFGTSEARV